MGVSEKVEVSQSDQIERLTAQLEEVTARLAAVEAQQSAPHNGNGHRDTQSRRDLLKMAGAAAAGAAGSLIVGAMPVAATDGNNIKIGTSVGNDGQTTTDIYPLAAVKSPLFQATGEGVDQTTTISPTASTSAPLTQSIPLIGAIGPGGALPQVGNPKQADYPGFAPIQGIGGSTTQLVSGIGSVQYSEGVNGWGAGATGIGVTGESDVGYGVAGGSGGIDLAALGSGRLLQLSLIDDLLSAPPAGPPNFTPNEFEQVRDGNGILWLSNPSGAWRRVNSLIPMTPFRLYDSRPTRKAANSITDIAVAGGHNIPSDAVGVFGNLTALSPSANGFLTIFPKGSALNSVNNLNYPAGVVALSNFVMVGLGTGGAVSVYVSGNGSTFFLFDVFGYII